MIHVGHACHLVELDGLRILTDPWLVDPIFAGCCEHAGPLPFGVGDLGRIDAIALSHGHLDHLNAPTLAALPDKSIPVVHPTVRFTEVDATLRLLGFHNLHPREDWKPFEIGTVRVVPTPSQGVLDECAFFVSGRGGRFFDGADAPQPPALMAEIRARLGAPDLAALSHNSFDQPALLGLAGSLVLGFLDLQAGQAHNRFYNELEEWLSGITELTLDSSTAQGNEAMSRTLLLALADLQRSIDGLAERLDGQAPMGGVGPDGVPLPAARAEAAQAVEATKDLAQGVHQLVSQVRNEQTIVRQWLDEQSSQAAQRHDDIARHLDDVRGSVVKRGS